MLDCEKEGHWEGDDQNSYAACVLFMHITHFRDHCGVPVETEGKVSYAKMESAKALGVSHLFVLADVGFQARFSSAVPFIVKAFLMVFCHGSVRAGRNLASRSSRQQG